ncbi:MAG TPA: hypothetical protein VD768_00600, partial [Sphingomicrobium sp.]|nr:hypothetical protein [Sphingomicrobium sp.]
LIGANTLIQGARALCTLELMRVLARRAAAPDTVWRASRRIALKIDLAALVACALAVGGLVGVLALRDLPKAATMVAVIALAIPAKHPFGLLVARRNRDVIWRLGVGVTAVAGAAVVLALGLPWQAAAVVIAVRDWGGLLATALFAGRRAPTTKDMAETLTFAEAAAHTEATARRQLSYRLMKTLFAMILGPVGNIAARTGRGAGRFDSKLSRLMPRNRAGIITFSTACAAIAMVLILVSREPLMFLVAAAFARLAALGGSAILWWKYKAPADEADDDDDD